MTLSAEYLIEKGFKLCDKAFGIDMPYYAKDAVLMFFNEPVPEYNLMDFHAGFGEMREGEYHIVRFRWINREDQVDDIYYALTGKIL
jgi:hypothetical protein